VDQLLLPLIHDGHDNDVVRACRPAPRACIAGFLAYLMEQYSVEMDEGIFRADDMLKAYEIWNAD
jgi:hypothetical protein